MVARPRRAPPRRLLRPRPGAWPCARYRRRFCWHTDGMERRERESIRWEAVPRENARRGRAELRAVAEAGASPLAGKPLRRRYRNFVPGVDSYVLSGGGPLPWMLRLRMIEDLTADHVRQL